jgi:hypothetical protein
MADLYQALKSLDELLELLVDAVMEEFKLELEDLSAVLGRKDDDHSSDDATPRLNG